MVNQSWESLHISCSLVQAGPILAEVLAEDAYRYLAVVSRKGENASKVLSFSAPEFLLSGLQPGTQYSVQLHAENSKGAGPAISLAAGTKKQAEKRTAESKIALEDNSEHGYEAEMTILGVVTGITGVMSCMVTLVIVMVRQKVDRARRGEGKYASVEGSHHGSIGSRQSSVRSEGENNHNPHTTQQITNSTKRVWMFDY